MTDCIANVEIRDDAYLGIMKQCFENENENAALPRAFELIALCLTAFAPTPKVADHLEYFLRSPKFKKYAEQHSCTFLLARALFDGSAKAETLPSQDEYAVHCIYSGRRYAGGALDGILDKRISAEKFETPTYTRENASWMLLRRRRTSISGDALKDVQRSWN